jgi:hypothetical protein
MAKFTVEILDPTQIMPGLFIFAMELSGFIGKPLSQNLKVKVAVHK